MIDAAGIGARASGSRRRRDHHSRAEAEPPAIVLLVTVGIVAFTPSVRSAPIEGYATSTGVVQGEVLELHVSTEALTYDVIIEDALDPLNVLSAYPDLPGTTFAVPDSAFAWGCNWPVTLAVPVDPQWPSGVYYARLVAPDVELGSEAGADTSFVPFVVLEDDPGSTSPILFQLSTTTYNAYNAWGGKSLYPQNSTNNRRSYFVSTQRPFDEERGKGQFPWYERPLAAWFRTEGIPVEFCTNLELHRDPNLTAPYQLFLSVGHDEYYSKPMYDQLEGFRNAGGNLAFLSGNDIFWQVRFEGETMVCYKDYTLDPYYNLGLLDLVTVNWRAFPVYRPEGRLIGVQYDSWCWRPCGEPLRLLEHLHWVTRDLGLLPMQLFGENVVGYEWDRRFMDAQPDGLELVFYSSIFNHAGTPRYQQSTYYEYPAANPISRVFAAGTVQWSWGVRPDSAGADSTLTTINRRIIRCLSQPATLASDREVVFIADLRHVSMSPNEAVWLRGRPAPLLPDGTNFRLLDDGVLPDSTAGDRIYTCAVTFAAGSWDVVRYSYWTVDGQCDYYLRSVWIEDPDLGPDPPVVVRDRPAFCPVITGVDDPDLEPSANDLRLRVHRVDGSVRIEVIAPSHTGQARVPEVLRAAVYDVSGRLVRILANGAMADPRTELLWAGTDERGKRVSAGVYLVEVQLDDRRQTAKIIW